MLNTLNLKNPSISNPFNFSGKTAFISASSQGLGLEIALGLAAYGARVYLNGRSAERLENIIHAHPELNLHAYCADMSLPSSIDDLLLFFQKEKISCDILVNNLGLRLRKDWQHSQFDDMQTLLSHNLLAPMYLSQQIASQMSSGGRIISIASVAGEIARKGDAIYPITKLGLVAMTRSLAVEYATKNITVNAISPGVFATPSNEQLLKNPDHADRLMQRIPMQRWGVPKEIGGVALFLASDLSSYMTGQVLTVDGGLSVLF